MNRIVILIISLISNICFANNIEVTCWSENKVVFHEFVEDAFYNDAIVGVIYKKETYFLFMDCIVKAPNKDILKPI